MFPLAVKILIILALTLQLASCQSSSQKLFFSASITFSRMKEKTVRNRTYFQLETIDQHEFANAVDMKIRTKQMKLHEGAVKSLPHLRFLRMKKCGVEVLEAGAFRNLPSLEEVHLPDNLLTIIVNGVFNYLPIKKLWLQRNFIKTIESSAFDNMPELEMIKLNRNLISKWDSRWFARTPKLSQLFFKRNLISELPKRAFVNLVPSHDVQGVQLVDLRILLSSNRISSIHPEAFKGTESLDELNLRKNQLREIDWDVFAHMTDLNKLSLKMNYLSKMDADAFKKIDKISELDLSKNLFECVPYEVIAKTKKTVLSGMYNIQCNCLHNLREKLKEERVETEIVARDMPCPTRTVRGINVGL